MKIKIGSYSGNNSKRKIKIKIHNYDIWNMDHTLALIIYPMLIKLRKNKTGVPQVDNEDVPTELRTFDMKNEYEHDIEDMQKKWHYVLDKMIAYFHWVVNQDDLIEEPVEGLSLFCKYYRVMWT